MRNAALMELSRRKKREAQLELRLFSMGNGRGDGRFRGIVACLAFLHRSAGHAIAFAQPAPQGNQAATSTAEGPRRPFLRPPALHPARTNSAMYPYHRFRSARTWKV